MALPPLQSLAAWTDLILTEEPRYIDCGLLGTLTKLAFRANLVLEGPKGIGKSLALAAVAHKLQVPLVTISCAEDMRRGQLVGQFILKGAETPFMPGGLTKAVQIAQSTKCILCLEEINALPPSTQKLLNALLDFRASLDVPEIGQTLKIPPGNLWIVGTMNASYGGTFDLNEDLKSRFRIIVQNYYTPEKEQEILVALLGDLARHEYVKHLLVLARETRTDKYGYALSTRDLVQVIQDSETVGWATAIKFLMGKYSQDFRETMKTRIKQIFPNVV